MTPPPAADPLFDSAPATAPPPVAGTDAVARLIGDNLRRHWLDAIRLPSAESGGRITRATATAAGTAR